MDVTPFVFAITALIVLGAALALLIDVAPPPGEAAEERLPLITQPYAPGAPFEQPTPYYAAPVPESPDPLEVAANLDRKALLATALMFGTLAMTGGYFGFGPQLRAAGAVRQLETSIERGAHSYASLCFDCHGKRGQGLIGFTLNKADFRASCGPNDQPGAEGPRPDKPCKPADDQKVQEFLFKTIARGRARPAPQYSMPAWSRDENGPLNSEQIQQLVTFIMHGDWEKPVAIREHEGLETEEKPPPPPKAPSPEEQAKTAINTFCVACHAFEPGKTSPNPQAPNLSKYGAEGPFNDQLKALKASGDPDWLKKWIADAPAIKPGTLMPGWKNTLGEDTIKALAEFLLGLK